MAFSSIDNLKTTLGLGARANLFEVVLTLPVFSSTNVQGTAAKTAAEATTFDLNILVKAAQVPAFTVGVIEVPYKAGRRIKIPGDRTFADWTVTIINDEKHVARRAFTAWIDSISKGNYDSASKSFQKDYLTTLFVTQYKNGGGDVRSYRLVNAFPTDVSGVDLSMDSTDTLSEFTVNFQYQYLTVDDTLTLATAATSAASLKAARSLATTTIVN